MKEANAVGSKKILYILNIAKKVNNFSYTAMMAAQAEGMEFHIAGNWSYASDEERTADEERYGIKIHQIDFIRAPYHPGNRRAYAQLKVLVQKEKYDVIHCNTPIGGVLGRIVGKRCNIAPVIYQAHGFHFYKGAPLLNWLLYYPIERLLARWTDTLVTINREDEIAAKKLKLRGNGKTYYVSGVGIDVAQYVPDETVRLQKRQELGLKADDIMLISMGDLIPRKNYGAAIRAIAKANDPRLQYMICGRGPEQENLQALAKELGAEKQIHFLGFRTDVKELLTGADIFLFTTRQEGLPRSMMEAMASGLPCVASAIRGNVDLIENEVNGYTCATDDVDGYAAAIEKIVADPELRQTMGQNNLEKIKQYDISVVEKEIRDIYAEVLKKV